MANTGIPQVPPNVDQELYRLLKSLKENVELLNGVRGRSYERSVTISMLLSQGIITQAQADALAQGA